MLTGRRTQKIKYTIMPPKSLTSNSDGGVLRDEPAHRQADGHGGADALLAGDVQPAAMQLDQADGQRQAEAGAGMLAVPGAGHLAETGHGGLNLGRVHADAAVDDLEMHAVLDDPAAHQYAPARMAELDGVGDEVEQHLLELERIRPDPGQVRGEFEIDGDVERSRPLRHEMQDVARHLADLDLVLVELDLAGFELRDVEDVADDAEQVLGAGADVAGIAGIAGAAERTQDLVGHDLGEADDGVQGRAQLVAHIGQELGLAAARQLG